MRKNILFFSLLFLLTASFVSCNRFSRTGMNKKKPNQTTKTNNNNTSSNGNNNNSGGYTNHYNLTGFTGTLTKDIQYANNTNVLGSSQKLSLDIYTPANSKGKKFPLIFLIHGGSFKTGDKMDLATTCTALTNNGYVCVSINYRLGWGSGNGRACNADTQQLKQEVYLAMQDTHSALNYVIAHAEEYSIDNNQVFIGGQSAGAIVALLTAYLSQKDADIYFPGYSKTAGNLEAGKTSKPSYIFRGVISMWGAFLNPGLITSATALPTLFFQGEKDPVVPFNTGTLAPCPGTTTIFGTYPLYNRLKELNQLSIAHVDPNGKHGVFTQDFRTKNILCFLNDVKEGIKKQEYLEGEQNSCN